MNIIRTILFCGTAMSVAVPAMAQDSNPADAQASQTAPQADTAGTGDIVVTARRRDERLQDVPVAVYAFSKPSDDPCLAALSSKLYARDLTTGSSVLIGSSGSIVSSVDIAGGIAGVALIQADAASSSATPPVLVQVTTMNGQVESVPVSLAGAITQKHRVTWGLVSP